MASIPESCPNSRHPSPNVQPRYSTVSQSFNVRLHPSSLSTWPILILSVPASSIAMEMPSPSPAHNPVTQAIDSAGLVRDLFVPEPLSIHTRSFALDPCLRFLDLRFQVFALLCAVGCLDERNSGLEVLVVGTR